MTVIGEIVTDYIERNPELHDFGEILMHEVRDISHAALFSMLDGSVPPGLRDLGTKLSRLTSEDREAAVELTSYMIDHVLAYLFSMLGEHQGEITLTAWGKDLYEVSDGLGGELYGEDGWINRFSQFPSVI